MCKTEKKNTVSLRPICGAERLNRESGENPEQFPLLYALRAVHHATERPNTFGKADGTKQNKRSESEDLPHVAETKLSGQELAFPYVLIRCTNTILEVLK